MSDKIELEGRLSEVADDLSIWDNLVKTPGWKMLAEIATQQVVNRSREILRTPLAGMDGALGQEYMKGEISGIELFSQIPEVKVAELKAERDLLTKELENESVTQETDGRGDAGSSGVRSLDRGLDDSGQPRDVLDAGVNAFGDD